MRRFTSIFVHTADFVQQTEITLHGVLQGDYTMRFFIDNKELELQKQDNRTWKTTGRPYVLYFVTIYTS